MAASRQQPLLWMVPLLLLIGSCSGQMSLAGERFQTTTDVTSWLNLANDAADMREADDQATKKDIYVNGRNAKPSTLAGLSLQSKDIMAQDAFYGIFLHTFDLIGRDIEGEQDGSFDQKPVSQYADTLVNDLFQLNVAHIETEAAIILNVWMQIVHNLYEVMRGCKVQDTDKMNAALDVAAALWIGADQPEGANDAGNLMYNLAQVGAERFNQANGESVSNAKVINGMNDIQTKIAGGTCENGEQGYMEMRDTINQLFGSMTIPLVQILIHHIQQQPADGGANFIELYALAFLPRVDACNPSVYKKLLNLLVRNTLNVNDKGEAISLLQSVYNCIGVTCEDIGSYESGEVPTCSDDEVNPEGLAGFAPTTDVHPHSFLDRDISSIRKMLHMGADEAALDYYMYGFSARRGEADYLTLHELATSTDRAVVPNQFDLYSTYFTGDDYAEKMITNVLTSVAPFDVATNPQRSQLVGGYLNEMVMYMSVLQKLYQATQSCDSNKEQSQASLDQAVAYYVGSIEGASAGGLDGGQLLYATSKTLCDDFSKCIDGAGSEVNQKLMASFDEMKISIQLGACTEVQTTLEVEVTPLLPVSLIQGSLHSAVVNADIEQGSEDVSLGASDPFALSMAPFINQVNADLGAQLLTNLAFRPELKPVSDGASAIFDLFKTALPQLSVPVDCQDIGQHDTFGSVCGDGAPAPTSNSGGSPATPPPTNAGENTPTSAPVESNPDILGFGRYVFTGDVSIAKLALDVRDMRNSDNIDAASGIYSNGANAAVSLASLSLDAVNAMNQDIDFNLFRFALTDEDQFGDGSFLAASTYADVAVQKALSTADDNALAAEASVILNAWMQIAHFLYESVTVCENGGTATDSLDQAVALWLGEGQSEASDNGFMVYTIAEQAATRFGHEDTSEAPVNTKLFESFNQARAIAVDCPAAPEMFLDLRGVVSDILDSLAVPLIQNLMYYIGRADSNDPNYFQLENYVELYALSVIPHLIGCSPSSFFNLQDTLIDNDFDNSLVDDDLANDIKALQKCFDITCTDLLADKITDDNLSQLVMQFCVKDSDEFPSIVGYKPASDVTQFLRWDRDIVQIGILAETGAYETALDMYTNGYNNRSGKRAVSLRSLATTPDRSIVPEIFSQISSYYGIDDFADKYIVDALKGEVQFAGASAAQRREVAIRMLQGAVSYMALLTQLYTAVDKCKANDEGAKTWWDQGVALFVGSIEGEVRGGDEDGYGEMIYSLGKEVCDDFGTCEASGDAQANEELMNSFSDGLALLVDTNCDSVANMIKKDIVPNLLVSLVQGTLDYSIEMEGLSAGSDDDTLGTGFALSRAILPQVNDSNSTSAEVIDRDMDFQLDSDPVPNGADAIFSAITYSISGMGVNCKKIGTQDAQSVCSETLRPHQSTPTEMGGGSYTSTTYVQDRANIALDVVAIENALNGGNNELAKLLYADGENSNIYDANGIKIGQRTLKSFSTVAPTEMADEPLFNIFRYALRDDQGKFLGQDVGLYADSIVNEAFDNTNPSSQTIGAEAVVVFNVWMYLVHELYQTLGQCKNKAIVDTDGIHSIDEAAAYWIGDGQVTGDSEQGHLLYALAEQMGEKFGLDESGQSRTNTNVLQLFNQAKFELSLPTACSDNPDTFPRLSQIVNRIVSWMTVPLVQGLIRNLLENDKDRVRMYARAVLPMVAGCSASTYAFLSEKLFAEDYNVVEDDDIIARIQSTYECLGFTCDDIGYHELDSTKSCVDPAVLSPLAGYVPQSDVRSFALLDLDILHANILMEMEAYGAVNDLYSHGKHATIEDENGVQTLSLYQMATSSERSIVPQFDSFNRYYESDKYADDIIRKALNTSDEKFGQASVEQRREIVVKTLQYLVVYMGALQEMYQGIADCNSPDAGKILDAEEAWDRGAAYLIGSLEGPEDGGHEEGLSFYRLALKRCEQFGTCTPEGRPSWNDEFSSLLYTGRASVQGRACGELRKSVREIEILLRVPLIQGTLRYALANEKLGDNSPDKGIGEGYAFSRSVLPLVEDSNRDSASIISENMDVQFDRVPVHQGARVVFGAFSRAFGNMNVNCEDVGSAGGINSCDGATAPSGPNDTNVGMIVGIIVGVFALIAIVAILVYGRKKKKKALEGQPSFVRPKGEMNHTPDRLTGDSYARGEETYEDGEDEENPDIAVLVSPGATEPMSPASNGSFSID